MPRRAAERIFPRLVSFTLLLTQKRSVDWIAFCFVLISLSCIMCRTSHCNLLLRNFRLGICMILFGHSVIYLEASKKN